MRAAVEHQCEQHGQQSGNEHRPTDAAAPRQDHRGKAFLDWVWINWLRVRHGFSPPAAHGKSKAKADLKLLIPRRIKLCPCRRSVAVGRHCRLSDTANKARSTILSMRLIPVVVGFRTLPISADKLIWPQIIQSKLRR